MTKLKFHLLASTLALLVGAPYAVAGGRGSAPAPVIEYVEIDSLQQHLTLNGNLFQASKLRLTLGKHLLTITEASQTQVVAKLPLNLSPGTYRLVIHSPASSAEAALLYLQVPRNTNSVQVASESALPVN